MIVREIIGVAALSISAIVPLWTARAVLGGILALLQNRTNQQQQ